MTEAAGVQGPAPAEPETGPSPGSAADPAGTLVSAAVRRLAVLAGRGGGWSDFWLEPGTSTSWVTAYAAAALAQVRTESCVAACDRELAAELLAAACDRLEAARRDGAWGWAEGLRPDADSTAWAARALLAQGRPIGDPTWAFLERHLGPAGAGTYVGAALGSWTAPMPEVTAVVLEVLRAGGRLSGAAVGQAWAPLIGRGPEWTSHWWAGPDHPSAVVLDAWRRSEPPAARPRPGATRTGAPTQVTEGRVTEGQVTDARGSDPMPGPERPTTSGLADALWVGSLRGRPRPGLAGELLARALPGGGWAGDTEVLVPPQHGGRASTRTVDARGAFTTATVLHASLALLRGQDRSRPTRPPITGRRPPRQGRDDRWDPAVARAAAAAGVPRGRALAVLASLTRESLGAGSPWPSTQLSSLASGQPIELSAGPAPGLRLTAEVGDPRLPAAPRLGSGLEAITRTARLLGVEDAWRGPAAELVARLSDSRLPVPEPCRFWLWAGVDLPAAGPPVLKAYLSLHAGQVDDWPGRLASALSPLPGTGSLRPALETLRGAGWCHEVGVGLLPGGRWGLKVYYELDRWRPDVVTALLTTCALPGTLSDLTADIPGVVHAAHRGRRRAGIALRVDPETGDIVELTTTLALPAPLVGRRELADRVLAWLVLRGQSPGPLRATIAAVEPDWAGAPALERMLGLVTLSAGRETPTATVYVRPRPRALPGVRPGAPGGSGR